MLRENRLKLNRYVWSQVKMEPVGPEFQRRFKKALLSDSCEGDTMYNILMQEKNPVRPLHTIQFPTTTTQENNDNHEKRPPLRRHTEKSRILHSLFYLLQYGWQHVSHSPPKTPTSYHSNKPQLKTKMNTFVLFLFLQSQGQEREGR